MAPSITALGGWRDKLGFAHTDLDEVFSLLARVGDAVVATVGPHSEVVVHDLRDPEHTVVAISGNLTRRSVGSPVPNPDLLPENVNRFDSDLHLYRTETPFGRSLLSSTVWVRDRSGHIVGALCINMDFADIRAARDLLERALTPDIAQNGNSLSTFATSGEDFVTVALAKSLLTSRKRNISWREDKILAMARLRDAGVFSLRRSSELVAAELGISRASVYSYLKDLREQPDPDSKVSAD
jgi:predicted transcriptional regulator YheO